MYSKGSIIAVLLSAQAFVVLTNQDQLAALAPDTKHKHGHHHHGHHHHHKKNGANATVKAKANASNQPIVSGAAPTKMMMKMKKLENEIAATAKHETQLRKGQLEMNGPLPANFAEEFASEVAKATGCKKEEVKVLNTTQLKGEKGVDEVVFEAPPDCVKEIEEQAADPDSKLAKGPLRIFLIEKDSDDDEEKKTADLKEKDGDAKLSKGEEEDADVEAEAPKGLKPEDSDEDSDEPKKDKKAKKEKKEKKDKDEKEDKKEKKDKKSKKDRKAAADDDEAEEEVQEDADEETPVQEKGIDIDTSMPYGELEPFGREDTAQELTKGSIRESDEMVDQLERAEVAEEKRAVFRALTRLRGAAITSFDGVARSQTGNIDEYARTNHWRSTHPVRHLAEEESDIGKWAFPENSDF